MSATQGTFSVRATTEFAVALAARAAGLSKRSYADAFINAALDAAGAPQIVGDPVQVRPARSSPRLTAHVGERLCPTCGQVTP